MGLPPMASWMVNGEDPDQVAQGDALVGGIGGEAPAGVGDGEDPGSAEPGSADPAVPVDGGLDEPEADGQLAMSVGELVDHLDGLPTMPDLGGLTLRPALRALADHSLDVQVEGSGFLVRQTPAAGVPVREGDPVALFFSADGSAEASD
ncbi:MAG: PASTA domain-containing protein, partial [Myxococcota bacterium]|nr:PASTA domain-containing protein [Myxococcota bacterium]